MSINGVKVQQIGPIIKQKEAEGIDLARSARQSGPGGQSMAEKWTETFYIKIQNIIKIG